MYRPVLIYTRTHHNNNFIPYKSKIITSIDPSLSREDIIFRNFQVIEEYFLLYLDWIYLLSMTSNFFTGYIVGDTNPVVILDLKRITLKYATTWFLADVCAVSNVFPKLLKYESIFLEQLLTSLKIIRIIKLLNYVSNLNMMLNLIVSCRKLLGYLPFCHPYIMKNRIYYLTYYSKATGLI